MENGRFLSVKVTKWHNGGLPLRHHKNQKAQTGLEENRYFCSVMKSIGIIVLFFLLQLNGCTSHSVSTEKNHSQTECTQILDKIEADLMVLYHAAADNRNAVHEEAHLCTPNTIVRVLTHRSRALLHNVSLRQTLRQTHRPTVSKLTHHPVTQFIAFPKEYHVFQLRRILI